MPAARTLAGLAALVAASLLLRSTALDAGYWIDEGLSVGIAGHGLTEIPGLLRQDGSPPLYYLLLHGWIAALGDGERATHALSLLLVLAMIPVAWWAARGLGGTRAAWAAAVLAATNGFLTYYAQETRMYALVALLSLLAAGLAARVLAGGRREHLPALVVVLAALLLTHTWAVFLLAAGGVAVALGLGAARDDAQRRALARDGALAAGGAAVLYLPWLPSLVAQVRDTGAPWSDRPGAGDLLEVLAAPAGGTPTALLLLAAGALGVRRLPRAERRTVVALAGVGAGAVLLAFGASQLEPAWATRYAAVAVGPLLLAAALGVAAAGRAGLVALAVVAGLGLADARTERLETKDPVREVAGALRRAGVGAGDLVISAHPERGPVARHYLGAGPRYADLLGPVRDPRIFDWRDATARLRAADPQRLAAALVASVRPGHAVVLLAPELRSGRWTAPWTRLVRDRTPRWEAALDADPRLRRVAELPRPGTAPAPRGLRAVRYVREPDISGRN